VPTAANAFGSAARRLARSERDRKGANAGAIMLRPWIVRPARSWPSPGRMSRSGVHAIVPPASGRSLNERREALTLPASRDHGPATSVDLVVCSSAFHWLD